MTCMSARTGGEGETFGEVDGIWACKAEGVRVLAVHLLVETVGDSGRG
jgi:hypothetical protein